MGRRNYLVEGVSGTGKTSICTELTRRGHQAVHGDRELAYQGDPSTGAPTASAGHQHHIWDVARVRELVADRRASATIFCGGSRNFAAFIELFDEVFVLHVDANTLIQRLDQRPEDEWGGTPEERAIVLRLHASQEDVPSCGVRLGDRQRRAQLVGGVGREPLVLGDVRLEPYADPTADPRMQQ